MEIVRKGNWFIHTQTFACNFSWWKFPRYVQRDENHSKLFRDNISISSLQPAEKLTAWKLRLSSVFSAEHTQIRRKHFPWAFRTSYCASTHIYVLALVSVKKEIVERYRKLNLFSRPYFQCDLENFIIKVRHTIQSRKHCTYIKYLCFYFKSFRVYILCTFYILN